MQGIWRTHLRCLLVVCSHHVHYASLKAAPSIHERVSFCNLNFVLKECHSVSLTEVLHGGQALDSLGSLGA
jgi:hypothetical protein